MTTVKGKSRDVLTSDEYRVVDLLHAAIDHLGSAKLLFEHNPRCYDSAGYLAHLGFELIFKAVLLQTACRFPKTHSFGTLLSEMKSAGVVLPFDASQQSLLDKFEEFKELRYPILKGLPSIEIGNQDWEQAEILFGWIMARLPAFQQHLTAIDHTDKFSRRLIKKPKSA